jgi:hypothetical protein
MRASAESCKKIHPKIKNLDTKNAPLKKMSGEHVYSCFLCKNENRKDLTPLPVKSAKMKFVKNACLAMK